MELCLKYSVICIDTLAEDEGDMDKVKRDIQWEWNAWAFTYDESILHVGELFFQDANSLSAPSWLMAVEDAQQLAGSGPSVLGKESDIHNHSDMAALRDTFP